MEFNTFETYQAEIEYRSNKIRQGVGRNNRRVRNPFSRKTAHPTRPAR